MATIAINTQKIFFSSYHRFVAGGSGVVLLGMGLSWHGFIVQRLGGVVKENPPPVENLRVAGGGKNLQIINTNLSYLNTYHTSTIRITVRSRTLPCLCGPISLWRMNMKSVLQEMRK